MKILNDVTQQARKISLDQIENGENIRSVMSQLTSQSIIDKVNVRTNYVERIPIRTENIIYTKYKPIDNSVRVYLNGIYYNPTCYTVDYSNKKITWTEDDPTLTKGIYVTVVYDYRNSENNQIADPSEEVIISLNDYRKKEDLITEDDLDDEVIELLNKFYDDTTLRNKIAFIENALKDKALRDELLAYRRTEDKIGLNDLTPELKDLLNSINIDDPYDSEVIKQVYSNLEYKADKSDVGLSQDLDSNLKSLLPVGFTIVDAINLIFKNLGNGTIIATETYGNIDSEVTSTSDYGELDEEVVDKKDYGEVTSKANGDE